MSRDPVAMVTEAPERAEGRAPPGSPGERGTVVSCPPVNGSLAAGTALPLTWGQRGLWALQRMAPASPVLHIAIAARVIDPIDGASVDGAQSGIDTAAFAQAVGETVARHPAWRTTFHDTPDGVEARVGASSQVTVIEEMLPAADPGGSRGGNAEQTLTERLEAIATQPFDLAAGPLVRVAVVRQGSQAHLLFVVHHLVADLWSLAVAMREVGATYTRLVQTPSEPRAAATPRVPPGATATATDTGVDAGAVDAGAVDAGAWGTYVARQEARLAGDRGTRLARFWRQQMADLPAPVELPADRPRPALPSFHGGVVYATLGDALGVRLKRWARQQGTTPLPVLLTAFNLLLARYTGQRDLVVATPAAGRGARDDAKLVGYLVQMIALRTKVDEDETFAALVAKADTTVKDALAHQGFPWQRLDQSPLAAGRKGEHGATARQVHAGRSPLLRVALAYQKAPRRGPAAAFGALSIGLGGVRFALGSLALESMPQTTRSAQLDLTVLAAEVDGQLGLAFQYDADRFDHATVVQWQRHFVALLGTALATPDVPAATLPLLDGDDQERLLRRYNDTARVHGLELESIDRLVARQVRATPDALAVMAPDGRLTYRQLGERAGRVARQLRALGAGPERIVGVFVRRSTWLPVALLGTLQTGAAYLQIDPDLPPERIAFLIRDAAVTAIATADALRDRLPAFDVPGVVMDQPCAEAEDVREPRSGPVFEAETLELDRLAYLIYTSGSTGQPKGVAVNHRTLRNLIGWYHHAYHVSGEDRVSQLSSLSFDATVFEIWPALTAGASLHLADEAVRVDPKRLAAWLRETGITLAFLPTPLAEAYLRQPGAGGPPLRVLQAAGDRLRSFRPPGFAARLLNLYGPTESTVATTEGLVPRASAAGSGALPSIGRPINNLRLYVLDGRQRLAPPGAAGELWIGGAGVARGYRGRPGLTADRFRPDPWGRSGDRLYRSGDRVRFRTDGELEFHGRNDRQLKIRGFRIEPGEIEVALRAIEGVAEAVVEARGEGDSRRLVAWVVLASGARGNDDSSARLAAALRQRLPPYMVPSAWMVIDSLPLTRNGKIDRRALPAPPAPGASGSAPRSATETVLAALWGELLAVGLPGRDDDFFALGGHSLLAAQLSARLRESLGVSLPMRALFEHPRLADLAAWIDAVGAGEPGKFDGIDVGQDVAITPRPEGDAVPLSCAQERLWFLDQLTPGLVVYNIPSALDLRGGLRVDVLAASLSALVARHEVLRTRFVAVTEDSEPKQVIDPATPVAVPVVDLGSLSPVACRAEVAAHAAGEAATPFDLVAGPLLRARLLRRESASAGQVSETTHTLLLTLHHAVADGLSMTVLQREIEVLYGALAADRPSPLPPLAVHYADYAAWQRGRLASGALDGQLAYWRERLAGIPEVLALPTDRPCPPVVDHRGARVTLTLDAGRVAGLEALARRHEATLFMLLLAAFDALLCRLTGEVDLVVGAPVAGRPRTELEPLIGLFVNLVPLRIDASGDPPFDTLLGRVRETVLDAFEHQEIPFERVVEAVQPTRDQGHTPIFQVLFALVDAPPQRGRLDDLEMDWWAPERTTAQLDLGLSLLRIDDQIVGELEYRTALFDDVTATRVVTRYEALLDAVLADAACPLSRLPLVTAPEVARLRAWNDTAMQLPAPARPTLPALIAVQAERTPDAVALEYAGQKLTYGGLMEQSARLARHLRTLGVGPEALVGICAERSVELVVGLLGILRAGGAYVPLDASYPRDRLAFMVEDARASVILAHTRLVDRLPVTGATLVALDEDAPWRAEPAGARESARESASDSTSDRFTHGHPGEIEIDRVDPDNLAYMIFTSGSTGRPKGAMNRHRSIVNRLLWMREAYRLTPSDRFLQKTPFSFDVSVWELFAPLVVGARLVIAPPEGHKDSHLLSQLIASAGVTIVHFVPSMLQAFLREPALDVHCASVRLVICSGEALPMDLVDRFAARLPALRLDNLYGPTEAAVEVTAWPCAEAGDARVVPIGRPIANTRMHVLDDRLRETPIGVAGELFIGGVQVGRGYHRRPGLTAERFVPDPLAAERDPGARLYATGDRARWRNDGTIEYLGRIDFQVKLRGLRIELGEIESVLVAHPRVREAVVGIRTTPAGDHLVAYVRDEGNTAQDPALKGDALAGDAFAGDAAADALREHLGTHLPEYMIPRFFLVLEALPLSPNGKVDRRALGRLPLPTLGEQARDRAPRTATEKRIAGLWTELLDGTGGALPGTGVDFFVLGGHSLLVTQLAGRLRRSFGVSLPLRSLFEHTTIATQAAAIDAAQAAVEGDTTLTGPVVAGPVVAGTLSGAPPLEPTADGESRQAWPLSFAQERLWLVDQMLGASAAYNMHGALQLDGPFVLPGLRLSLDRIVARHEALRTTFPSTRGRPRAVISEARSTAVEVVDLADLPPRARDLAAEKLRRSEAAWHFDLARGPLLRIAVVRLTSSRHQVFLTLHHIVADGWSLGVLQRELMMLYAGFADSTLSTPPTSPSLPSLPVQYRDYAVWQRDWLQDDALARHIDYWRAQLGDQHPIVRLPGTHRRLGEMSPQGTNAQGTSSEETAAVRVSLQGATQTWELSAARTEALRALGHEEHATLFMVVLATLEAVLHRYTGAIDIRVGAPVANRRPEAVEGLIGCFVNMLVLRGDFAGDPTFRDFLGRVRDAVVGAQEHQDMPYEKLVEVLRPARDAGQSALFNVVLAFQDTPANGLAADGFALPSLKVTRLPAVSEHAKFDLSLHAEVRAGDPAVGLTVALEYRTEALDAATVVRLTGHLEQLIDGVIADADRPISALPLVTPAERAALLHASRDLGVSPDLIASAGRARENPAAADDTLRIHVLDPRQRLVPVEVVGELCLASGDDRDPLYRTGEGACWHNDGSLERLGRLDRWIASRAPRSVARTPRAADGRSVSATAPETPEESALADIFADVLGVASVGRHDDFFALGGHSLLATQAAARIREALGVDLELRTLFEHATVAALAVRLTAVGGVGSAASRLRSTPVTPVSGDLPLVLSFAQERLWVLDQLEPGSTAYNMPAAMRLSGCLDLAALGSSLDSLVARHQSLRTVFVADEGVPRQVILPAQRVPMTVVDLRTMPTSEEALKAPREVARLRGAHARIAFDLARGPLLAVQLLRLADDLWELLLNVHHIVFDGWSFGVFSRELGALYQALVEKGASQATVAASASALPTPRLQYADYAAWQRSALDVDERSRQLAYWRDQLAAAPLGTDLPTDRPRQAVRTFRGGQRSGGVGIEVRQRLEALGLQQGATLFMVLLAGWKAILHRLAGQDDVLVGTPIAGRTREELEGLIGVFLNSLVLRTDVGGNPTFTTLIERIRETTLGAYAHQDVPFEMLIEALAPERDASRTPFFQVFFNMLDLPHEPLELVGLRLEPVTVPEAGAKFDLTVYAARTDDGLRFDLSYNADLFDETRMAALMDAYAGFLTAVSAAPETPVGAVPLGGTLEAEKLPAPQVELDDTWHGSVHTWFARRADEAPEHLALRDPQGAWTYGELAAHVHQLARQLMAAGVGREAAVAIYAHRCASLVWAVMAVTEAGGSFLMLDPTYPPARLIAILQRARPVVWLQLAQAGPPPAALVTYIEGRAGCTDLTLPPLPAGGPSELADDVTEEVAGVGPDDRALLAFTSGSTGEPKGIEGRHGPLTHFLPWQQATFGLDASDRYSMLSGLAHDPLQRDVFTALATGATLCIPDTERMLEPGYLASWMRETGITVAHMTPAIGQILAEPPPGGALVEVPSLRLTMLVGDALTQRDVARLRDLAPAVRVINLYGATETQRAVSWHDGTAEANPESRQVLALGRGMDDVQLLVVNPVGQLAGIGELGEIWVRSPHLARGYLEDPERTAERFQANPWTGAVGDRVYRTGDLGRYRPDGEVTFAGRADQQVKVRGFRVELGEIEAQLLGHPDVVSAAVVQCGPEHRLAAFVAGTAGEQPAVTSVRQHLVDRLPSYMIPAAFVVLEALPLNPNGKLDRRALAKQAAEQGGAPEAFADAGLDPRSANDHVAPRSDTERALATVWAKVLGHERVGIRDSFFALGGDSLLAIRMVSLAHRSQLDVDAKLLFQYQTIEELAPHVRAAASSESASGALAPVDGPVRLTQVQRRFFEEVLVGVPDQAHHFNIDRLVAVPPQFDLARLARAVEVVLRSHDAFALRLQAAGDGGCEGSRAGLLRQFLVDPDDAGLTVSFVDLSALEETARSATLESLAERLQRSLDLFDGPLLRACIFDFGAGEYARLLLIAHHFLADAYSLVVVQEDVAVAYEQLGRGESVRLPSATTPFTTWAGRLNAFVDSPALDAERSYWLDQPWDRARHPLIDNPEASMPIDSMRGHVAALDAGITDLLMRQAPKLANGAGLNEVVLTALARAAVGWDDSNPVGGDARPLRVDIIGHGRDALMEGIDLSRTVGWLAVIFPLLVAAADDDPIAAMLAVRAHALSVPNSGVGYGLLRFAAADPAGRVDLETAIPRAGIVLNFLSRLGVHDREAATDSMILAPEQAGPRLSPTFPLLYPLMLHCAVTGGQLCLRWNYSANRYRRETVERMADDVHAQLQTLADRCRARS